MNENVFKVLFTVLIIVLMIPLIMFGKKINYWLFYEDTVQEEITRVINTRIVPLEQRVKELEEQLREQ